MNKLDSFRNQFEEFLRHHFTVRRASMPMAAHNLINSMEYSLFSGGKRFRPVLASLVADTLSCSYERILPFASAVEMVHTYSLIHDDLPCMDDDDIRRGVPTNHVQFNEATALLAGDALLTEAFSVISQHYEDIPEVGLKLCRLLSEAAGLSGMVAGQVVDISMVASAVRASAGDANADHDGAGDANADHDGAGIANIDKTETSQDLLLKMHELKTGALIRVAAEGAAVIARADEKEIKAISEFGLKLGLAFQLADDVLDYDPSNLEASGFPKQIGLFETQTLLDKITKQALRDLEVFDIKAQGLRDLVEFNFTRKI